MTNYFLLNIQNLTKFNFCENVMFCKLEVYELHKNTHW
jgi:hypothetical protein